MMSWCFLNILYLLWFFFEFVQISGSSEGNIIVPKLHQQYLMPLLMARSAGNLTNSLWFSITLVLLGLARSIVLVSRWNLMDWIVKVVRLVRGTLNKINTNINWSLLTYVLSSISIFELSVLLIWGWGLSAELWAIDLSHF